MIVKYSIVKEEAKHITLVYLHLRLDGMTELDVENKLNNTSQDIDTNIKVENNKG